MFVFLNYFAFFGLFVRITTMQATNECTCNDSVTPPFSKCPNISHVICYGSTHQDQICAYVSCMDASTYVARCTDRTNGNHGTWSSGNPQCEKATTLSIQTTTSLVSPTTQSVYSSVESTSSSNSVSTVVTTPIAGSTISTSVEITPTSSSSYTTESDESTQSSSSVDASESSTSSQVTSTEHAPSQSEHTSDDNVAVYVSVPIVIIVTAVIVVLIVIFLRRRARRAASDIKEPLHGSISNNLYQDHELNDNVIPMTNLTPGAQTNMYMEITDVGTAPVNNTDDNYNTISIVPSNEYSHLKPFAKSFVDNTYSHANKSRSVDLYNHTEKTAISNTASSSGDVNDPYSHLGKDFAPQEKKQPDVEDSNTYNTLSTNASTGLHIKPLTKSNETDEDPEYNHLSSAQQSAPNSSTTDTNGTVSCPTEASLQDADTVQDSTVSHQYEQVVESENEIKEDKENKSQKRAFKIADDEADSGANNDGEYHSYLVLEPEQDEDAEDTTTETGHQYFTLEKREKE